MRLIIAEKHSVGDNIAKVVGAAEKKSGYIEGNGYIVSWCVGHLVRLSLPDKYGEQYENYWTFDNLPIIPVDWKFELDEQKMHQFKLLKELMSRDDVESIICATDAGREGECIFRYVYNYARCTKPVERLWVSSMEDKAIREGMAHLKPDSDYDNLFNAGFSRAKADWLVGMNGSRLMSNRYGVTLSVGRVRTPVLSMIVKRDYDIAHFTKQKFYNVILNCGEFTVSSERLDNENMANALLEKCNGKAAVVSEVKKEVKTVNPPKLYDLTTLQREANRQFGYTARQTLEYTQSLYEAKLVTYPRTDSQYITDDMEQTTLDMTYLAMEKIFNIKDRTAITPNVKCCINNAKVSDHHAIIPTAEIRDKNLDELPTTEKNILFLIAGKLITATAKPHKYEYVKVTLTCDSSAFTASGKTVLDNGFKGMESLVKSVIGDKENKSEEKENKLPEINEGQIFESVKAEIKSGYTSPPVAYTEDTLLKAMETAGNGEYDENSDVEKKGLGTPATRADIIEKLLKDKYIVRDKKKITATELGVKLIGVVPNEIKSAKLTADWETELQNIENGKSIAEDFMNEIETFINKLVANYSEKTDGGFASKKEILGKCPRCGKNIYEGKLNYYCESGKDGCGFSIWKKNKFPEADIGVQAIKKFLTEGKAELKTVNKDGKPYTGTFEMIDTGKYINFKYLKTERVAVGVCPICGKKVFEYEKGYFCEDRECNFVIWKSINGKSISASLAKKLIENGSTDLIKGFKRKDGTVFNAFLILKDDKSVGFKKE